MAWILRTGFQGINTYVTQSIYKPRIWLNRQNEKTEVSSGEKSGKMATLYIITSLCVRCLNSISESKLAIFHSFPLPPYFCQLHFHSQFPILSSPLPFNHLPYVHELNLEEASYTTFHKSSPSFPFHCYYPHLQSHCL